MDQLWRGGTVYSAEGARGPRGTSTVPQMVLGDQVFCGGLSGVGGGGGTTCSRIALQCRMFDIAARTFLLL